MRPHSLPLTEMALIGRLSKPDATELSPAAAREILSLQWAPSDQQRIDLLSQKAQEGTLTPDEQSDLECLRRAGFLLGIFWSKARLALSRAGEVPDERTA